VAAKFDLAKENDDLRAKLLEDHLKNTDDCTGCAQKQLQINHLRSTLANLGNLVQAAKISQSLFFDAGLQGAGLQGFGLLQSTPRLPLNAITMNPSAQLLAPQLYNYKVEQRQVSVTSNT
jgi:hypothetical protein